MESRVQPPLERLPRREKASMVPAPVPGEPGLFAVDATWGTIAPMTLDGDVITIGELELISHVEAGGALVDTRRAHFVEQGLIPTARQIVHDEIVARSEELDRDDVTVLYCNGPQCAATPEAIAALLASGYPPESLRFYRGGIHDWVTLGLPLAPPESSS